MSCAYMCKYIYFKHLSCVCYKAVFSMIHFLKISYSCFFFLFKVNSNPNVALEFTTSMIKSHILQRLSQPGAPDPIYLFFKFVDIVMDMCVCTVSVHLKANWIMLTTQVCILSILIYFRNIPTSADSFPCYF